MIDFNKRINDYKSKELFKYFVSFVHGFKNKSDFFIDEFSKSDTLCYPEKYTNGVQIKLSNDQNRKLSIQSSNCGIYISNENVMVCTKGIYHFTVSTSIGKDDIFNLSISTNILPIAYEDIEFLINFRMDVIRSKINEEQSV